MQNRIAKANSVSPSRERIEIEIIRLYEEHSAGLIRYAFSLGRDNALAQDAVQVGFYRYFLHRSDGKEVDNGQAWLFRVVRNYILDRLRETTSRGEVPISEVEETTALADDGQNSYEKAELMSQISQLLSPREFQCVQLRQQDLSYEEIASILKISPGTVGALLTRALKKLRAALWGASRISERH